MIPKSLLKTLYTHKSGLLFTTYMRKLLKKKILGLTSSRKKYFEPDYRSFFFGKLNKRVKGFSKYILTLKRQKKKTNINLKSSSKITPRSYGCGAVIRSMRDLSNNEVGEYDKKQSDLVSGYISFMEIESNANDNDGGSKLICKIESQTAVICQLPST